MRELELSYDAAWVARGDDVRWQVACDHAPCTHNSILSNAQSGTDDGAATEPDAISDGDRQCVFKTERRSVASTGCVAV